MTMFQHLYLGDRASSNWAGTEGGASPVLAQVDVLRNCPKTYLFIAGQDLLQAECHKLAQKLREAGIDVSVREYEKAPHMFMAMDQVLDSGKRAVEELIRVVQETLAEGSQQPLKLELADLKNRGDRKNLLEQVRKASIVDAGGEQDDDDPDFLWM
jgi:hypothetical protein